MDCKDPTAPTLSGGLFWLSASWNASEADIKKVPRDSDKRSKYDRFRSFWPGEEKKGKGKGKSQDAKGKKGGKGFSKGGESKGKGSRKRDAPSPKTVVQLEAEMAKATMNFPEQRFGRNAAVRAQMDIGDVKVQVKRHVDKHTKPEVLVAGGPQQEKVVLPNLLQEVFRRFVIRSYLQVSACHWSQQTLHLCQTKSPSTSRT
eukprot:s4119_g2.t1